jgi:hypothetical protein
MDEMAKKPSVSIPAGTVLIRDFIGSWNYKKLDDSNLNDFTINTWNCRANKHPVNNSIGEHIVSSTNQ